jgi:hypothetical protein
MTDSDKSWQRPEGYRGQHFFVHDGNWRIVIRDDILSAQ